MNIKELIDKGIWVQYLQLPTGEKIFSTDSRYPDLHEAWVDMKLKATMVVMPATPKFPKGI